MEPTTAPKGPRTVHLIGSFNGNYHAEEKLKKELGAVWDDGARGSVIPADKIEQARAAGFRIDTREVQPPPDLPPEAHAMFARYGLDPAQFSPKHTHDKGYESVVRDLSHKHPFNLRSVASRERNQAVREALMKRLAEVETDPATDALPTPYTTYTPTGKPKESNSTWGEIKAWRATPGRTHYAPASTAKWDGDRERRVGGGPLSKGAVVPGRGVVAEHREIGGNHEYLLRPFSAKERAADGARAAAEAAESQRVLDAMRDR